MYSNPTLVVDVLKQTNERKRLNISCIDSTYVSMHDHFRAISDLTVYSSNTAVSTA